MATSTAGPAVANAGGFYVPEIGARASGMGAAMTTQSQDSSAIFHNPAGLVGQQGTQVQLSLNLFLPRISFFRRPVTDTNSADGQELRFDEVGNTNAVLPAPYIGAVTDLGRDDLAIAFAVYAPFGAAIDYPRDGAQRHVVTGVDLKVIHASLGAGYQVSKQLRLGATVHYVFSALHLNQRNAIQYVNGDPEVFPDPASALEGDTSLKATDPFSISTTLGALYSDAKGRFDLGLSVMTPVTLSLKGDAIIDNDAISPLMDEAGTMIQPAGQRLDNFSTELPLPLIVRVGAAIHPHPRLMVAFDVNWQRWSTFKEMTIDFEAEHELLPTPGVYLYDVTLQNQWKDTFSARLGAEARPLADRPLILRGGVLYDQSPIDDQHFDLLTPDSDKIGVGAGLSYALLLRGNTIELDLAFQHLFLAERDVTDSEKTILNKPASSFYNGITRAGFDIVVLSSSMRF